MLELPRHRFEYGAPNSYVAVVCVTLVPTPVPEKKIRSNIWWGLSPGIYGTIGNTGVINQT